MKRSAALFLLILPIVSCADQKGQLFTSPQDISESNIDIAPLIKGPDAARIPGEYIVRLQDGAATPQQVAEHITARFGGEIHSVWPGMRGFWANLPVAAVEALRRNPQVAYVEESIKYYPSSIDTQYVRYANWGLDRIDQRQRYLDDLYIYHGDGSGVRIWIVDSGVDGNEPDLAARIDSSFYSTYNGADPFAPCYSHGTSVAVLAAGSNYGVAKGATINVARVSGPSDCTEPSYSSGAIANALQFIADYSPRPAVINGSFGRECPWYGCGSTVDDAVRYAVSEGVPVIVSAGNDGNNACDYSPARVSEAVTVGASTSTDERVDVDGWWTSNYGSCLDLFAPGVYLNVGSGGQFHGTSAATPMVAGVVALHRERNGASLATSMTLASATSNVLSGIGSGSPNKLLYSIPPLMVDIVGGPVAIDPPGTYTWTASPSGDTGIYTSYQWETKEDVSGAVWYPRGTAASQTISFYEWQTAGFSIRVTVTSSGGSQAASTRYVSNVNGTCVPEPPALEC